MECLDYLALQVFRDFRGWQDPQEFPVFLGLLALVETAVRNCTSVERNITASRNSVCRGIQCTVHSASTSVTVAILKVVKLLYLNEKSTDFDKIWYTPQHICTLIIARRPNRKLFKIQDGERPPF